MVHVRDANLAAVTDAQVTTRWTLPDGSLREGIAVTEFQCIATFMVWGGSSEYKLCVTNVVKDGWRCDPTLIIETCGSLVVKWPFNPPE